MTELLRAWPQIAVNPYDIEIADGNAVIALQRRASNQAVKLVLEAVQDWNGRSEFVWLKLPSSEIALATFPMSRVYEECVELDDLNDWDTSRKITLADVRDCSGRKMEVRFEL